MSPRNSKNVRIICRLLERPDGTWTRYGLSKAASISQPYGVRYIKRLNELGLVKGTRVMDLHGLAAYGAGIVPAASLRIEMYHPQPLELLKEHSKRYALTTYFAENLQTRHLFPTRCDAYVSRNELVQLKEVILKEGLLGGGNMRFIVPADEYILDEVNEIDGIRVVFKGRLMLDLFREGGVCVEAFDLMGREHV